jgi:hypothetical protein
VEFLNSDNAPLAVPEAIRLRTPAAAQ